MKVSIIMPYYNAAKYIYETVNSIIVQTYNDWELIIIDDCSPDPNTISVLNNVKSLDSRIIIAKTKENSGPGNARNIGIEIANGRYIAFCDSDDWWYPTKLEEQIKFMQNNGYEFTCTYYEDTYEDLTPYYTMKQSPKQCFKSMISGCNIGTPGVVYDTIRIGKVYMPQLRRAEDWGTWMKILKDVDYVYTYPKALWKYRHITGSASSNKLKMCSSVIGMYRSVLEYSLPKALLVFCFKFLPKNVFKKLSKSK